LNYRESGEPVLGIYIRGVARGALDWVSFFLSLWREFRWMDPSGVGPTCWMCAVG